MCVCVCVCVCVFRQNKGVLLCTKAVKNLWLNYSIFSDLVCISQLVFGTEFCSKSFLFCRLVLLECFEDFFKGFR